MPDPNQETLGPSSRAIEPILDDITKQQVAILLHCSESTVARLSKRADFPRPYKIGGRVYYSEKEVRAWHADQKAKRLMPS